MASIDCAPADTLINTWNLIESLQLPFKVDNILIFWDVEFDD